ncbi:hypothetical protein PR048_020352 [Dryococelus australis]|uniref:J domain-containing protein n=1 Tax=Dryococelus australis TaxID=614101 RepID=A0ABQ9H630_9NEOP|nr:hypothetical protein PR048_020352 [Dryococelus australis]
MAQTLYAFLFLGFKNCPASKIKSWSLTKTKVFWNHPCCRNVGGLNNDDDVDCYCILQLSKNCDEETARQAFLKLVKRFHPDSSSPEANAEKFSEIERAYRKLQRKFSDRRWNSDDGIGEYGLYYEETKAKEFDIQHTAPQHRQYLSYGGYGSGNPLQREKQYQKHRAATAINSVYNHRVSKLPHCKDDSIVVKDIREAQKNKIRSEMDRLVEDLIQESMARGEFDNLPGKGKPLPYKNTNPYVDFVTHKMNEVLIENGFTPEWITLQKEIRVELELLRDSLGAKRARLGETPLTSSDVDEWQKILSSHEQMVKKLNSKINTYNLVVPLLTKQMSLVRLDREADIILKTGKTKHDVRPVDGECVSSSSTEPTFLSFLSSIFAG